MVDQGGIDMADMDEIFTLGNDGKLTKESIAKISGIMFLDDWMTMYNRFEPIRDPEDRFCILLYELGDVARQLVYKKRDVTRISKEELEIAFADCFMMLMSLARFMNIESYSAIKVGLERLIDRNWKNRCSKEMKGC